jgi:ELWxxDGT repeat protein
VKDIRNGSPYSNPSSLTNVNGTLYFTADDGRNGEQLWRSDGTNNGTVLVRNIGSGFSPPSSLMNMNGTLYFTADDGTNGTELWKSDGTAAGTVLVKDIRSGSSSAFPSSLTNVNGTLYFKADDGTNGTELWKSNGTATGTVMVKDIAPGVVSFTDPFFNYYSYPRSSSPSELTNVNGTLYFTANNGTNGVELWKSNGTAAGTVAVKDIRSGEVGAYPSELTNVSGTLYFKADDNSTGDELWRSDGSVAGTLLVKDIRTGSDGAYPSGLTNVNGMLHFTANDGRNGRQLWKSNGTAAGTLFVADLAGSSSLAPSYLTNVNGMLYFTANHRDLWRSNGTPAGTARAVDRASGVVVVNNLVYVTGDLSAIGSELYVQDLTRGTELNDAFVLKYSGTGSDHRVTVTLSTNGGPVETLGIFPTTFPLPISGLGGNDSVRIEGTTGADTFIGEASRIVVNGARVLLSGIESRTLAGGAGNDFYRFDADSSLGAFTLDETGGGVDTINLAATVAAVRLNLGASVTQSVNANLSLKLNSPITFENAIGGSGADYLIGNSLNNTLIGGAGVDTLNGALGSDILTGGPNSDTYLFGPASVAEADQVNENPIEGFDTLNFATVTTSVVVNLGANSIQPVHANRTLKLNSPMTFDNVVGGSGADTLIGNTLNNLLTGGPGDDNSTVRLAAIGCSAGPTMTRICSVLHPPSKAIW